MKITYQQVQQNVADIANRHESTPDVLYELLAAYGRAKSAITQLREGLLNKAEDEGRVLQKDVVYFWSLPEGSELLSAVEKLYEDPLTGRYNPRYLIATDLKNIATKDLVTGEAKNFKLADIDRHLEFFYGWTGNEITKPGEESPADRRAADKMNELYAEIEKLNRVKLTDPTNNFRHELNIFFTRLLFCFFAEDTGIFGKNQFTDIIKNYSESDGSDLAWFFDELFTALNTKPEHNLELKPPFNALPYVNGTIFDTSKHAIAIPEFNAQARHLILECSGQNWGEINPDIFGTMFQGVVDPEHRDENGMDYTSVPNIMKVIEPLFLDGLEEQFDKYYDNEKKLWALFNRISSIKLFDPACGSGNFLIVSYKKLRQLQHKIVARIDELMPAGIGSRIPSGNLLNITNLYGIEIDDFARELAILSIFLAKHQMNMEFNKQFGTSLSLIPLDTLETIVHDNAARLDWQTVCPNVGHTVTAGEQSALFELGGEQAELQLGATNYDEIYLIGNPPYKGADKQTSEQKADFKAYFGSEEYSGNSDYISIWFIKGARYIKGTKAQLAFVSVNSVCQGEHVSLMFPKIFDEGVEVGFAHTSFKWQNSARDQAGVTVIVLSLRNLSKAQKYLFTDYDKKPVDHINAYLLPSEADIVFKLNKSISKFPEMVFGSMPRDEGNLVLSPEDKDKLTEDPRTEKFIKKYLGAAEYIRGNDRYCLWIEASDYEEAKTIPAINERMEKVAEFRAKSKAKSTQDYAARPYRFVQISYKPTNSIIVPSVSSERREYIPMGFLDKDTVVSNAANAIYDAEPWLFSLLQSKIHMAWIRTVCGQLETRIRYSTTLGYNTFPIHALLETEKDALNKSARRILLARAAHPEKTLADMYDPDKMPADLREAHNENDRLVDSLYKKGGFSNDEDRLAALFDLYEQMTAKEK